MPGKILIVDGISTNRIVLKVKLSAAYYDVYQAASAAEALTAVRDLQPDLMLVSDRLPDMSGTELCRLLRDQADAAPTPIILLSPQRDSEFRLAALKAGADDVLVKPSDDKLLLARLRSLLRTRATTDELHLREGTNRALGFAEARVNFDHTARVLLVTAEQTLAMKWAAALQRINPASLSTTPLRDVFPHLTTSPLPDAIVLGLDQPNAETAMRLMADLRARAETRYIPVLVVLSRAQQQLASDALDLGANDMMGNGFDAGEMALRLERLVRQKHSADRLRIDMRDGLMAAVIDPLTGLFNRRYAMPHLARMVDTAQQKQRNFAVMLADLDHFKQVNDKYGHAAGDAVLVAVSRALKHNLRAIDLAARIGGEEFLIAMPDTDHTAAKIAAKRLCDIVQSMPIQLPNQAGVIHITISIGVAMGIAQIGGRAPPVESLIEIADRALYDAKPLGRNQVTFSNRPAA